MFPSSDMTSSDRRRGGEAYAAPLVKSIFPLVCLVFYLSFGDEWGDKDDDINCDSRFPEWMMW